jgi:SAM-dependent methyltransferase
MALSDVFASNIFVRWLRGDPNKYQLPVAIISVRMGHRLLALGAGEPALTAALAKITGLSGGAQAYAPDAAGAARLEAAAAEAGILLDVTHGPPAHLPFPDGALDIVVLDAVGSLPEADMNEVRRVLRPGGRVVAVTRTKPPGGPAVDALQAAIQTAFRAARVLADRDGWAFVEALKPGDAGGGAEAQAS